MKKPWPFSLTRDIRSFEKCRFSRWPREHSGAVCCAGQAFAHTRHALGKTDDVSMAVGSSYAASCNNPEALLNEADAKMYKSKKKHYKRV